VHGMTAITAITAQNTIEVSAVAPVSPQMIVAQVRAVAQDIGVDAVKVGMLGDQATISAVLAALDLLEPGTPLVVDPVMVAESGAVLLEDGARAALASDLLPRATVATPNLAEARVLAAAGEVAAPEAAPHEAQNLARAVLALGPQAVVVTGGHRDPATDVFHDGQRMEEIPGERFPDGAAHGSGCTHSSALAAGLALGLEPLPAARRARQIAAEAVRDGLRELGRGAGPVSVLGRPDGPAASGGRGQRALS
jgi:hydroxymethylpyrimidine/phosphomethylpyrimidine kinase